MNERVEFNRLIAHQVVPEVGTVAQGVTEILQPTQPAVEEVGGGPVGPAVSRRAVGLDPVAQNSPIDRLKVPDGVVSERRRVPKCVSGGNYAIECIVGQRSHVRPSVSDRGPISRRVVCEVGCGPQRVLPYDLLILGVIPEIGRLESGVLNFYAISRFVEMKVSRVTQGITTGVDPIELVVKVIGRIEPRVLKVCAIVCEIVKVVSRVPQRVSGRDVSGVKVIEVVSGVASSIAQDGAIADLVVKVVGRV